MRLAFIIMGKFSYKKYRGQDHKALAVWAADCAERVLPFFENAYPGDGRPREAIGACREWVGTGVFKMAVIRGASLAAHAAAREVAGNDAACFAARASGQAAATPHVAQHAFGSAYYGLKAVIAADPFHAETNIAKELEWLSRHLPENLRQEVMGRISVKKNPGKKIMVKIQKGEGF